MKVSKKDGPLDKIENAGFISSSSTSSVDAEKDYSEQMQLLEFRQREEEIEGMKQDREQRRQFASKIFCRVMIYLFTTIAILVACAAVCACGLPTLSDSVLIALLTTASANVIGLLMVVVRYLFHHPKVREQ